MNRLAAVLLACLTLVSLLACAPEPTATPTRAPMPTSTPTATPLPTLTPTPIPTLTAEQIAEDERFLKAMETDLEFRDKAGIADKLRNDYCTVGVSYQALNLIDLQFNDALAATKNWAYKFDKGDFELFSEESVTLQKRAMRQLDTGDQNDGTLLP